MFIVYSIARRYLPTGRQVHQPKLNVSTVARKIAAYGHSFAFGRAFGKRPVRNCCRCKIQKL